VGVGQVSRVQGSLTKGSGIVTKLEWTLDLRAIPLPKGSIRSKSDEDHIILSIVEDMGMNLAALPLQTLHALHQDVSNEFRIKEKCALIVISEFKINNE